MDINKLNNATIKIRSINIAGLEALKSKIEKNGLLDNFPILIDEHNNIIDGHHRFTAAKELGITDVPVLIKSGLSDSEKIKLAFMANEASETNIPMTMVDYCEFIWASSEKLSIIAIELGWSESKVKDYSAMQKVATSAWHVIVANINGATSLVASATFTQGILRQILKLIPPQQLELVTDLANDTINKNKFKVLAEKYSSQNEDMMTCIKELKSKVNFRLIIEACQEIRTGRYDLENLIQSKIDKFDKKTSIKLIHGDFYEEVSNIRGASVDLIVTDPPYNIAHERTTNYSNNGRKDISKDFGEWDKVGHREFIDTFSQWAESMYHILKPHKACYIWTSDIYISHISEAFTAAGFKHKSTITWHKTNPGTSQMKDNFISSNEYCLYFIKDSFNTKDKISTLNWMGENEMQNFMQFPICGGGERIKDNKGNVLHPTQKPMKVIQHITDISSNKGDLVFDGFMGSGTTAAVCKKTDRKFIGIEFDIDYFKACQERING